MSFKPLDIFLPYQVRWIMDDRPIVWWEKGRQEGASWTEAYRSVERRISRGTHHNFMSRVESTAKQFIQDAKFFAKLFNAVAEDLGEQVVVKDKDIKANVLRFANGAEIRALTSSADAARGLRGDFTFDEIAFHRQAQEAYENSVPSARMWGHQVRVMSTHQGKNSFFNLTLERIRSGKLNYGLHRVTLVEAVEQGLAEAVRQVVEKLPVRPAPDEEYRRQFIADRRAECTSQQQYDREYMCIPEEDGDSYLTYGLIDEAIVANLKLFTDPSLLDPSGIYYCGYDVGRRHDLSVLWVDQLIGDVFWARMLRVLDRQKFSVQAGVINNVMAHSCVKRICIDETGIGMQLAEQAQDRWGSRAEPVNFSAPVKAAMGASFRDDFLDHKRRIPSYVDWDSPDGSSKREDWLREDLHKTKKHTTVGGHVRLQADGDEDGHADGFWSGALAKEAVDMQIPLPPPRVGKPAGY